MSDDTPHDETQPVRPAGAAPPPAPAATDAATEPPVAETPAQRRGFRERLRTWRGSRDGDRTYGLAALIASALAGIIVGGLGVATFQAVTDDHGRGRDGWVQRDDDRGPGDRGGMRGGPRGVPGQLPPTTAPEDEDGSAS
jgi:hypothetical protein